MEKKQTNLDKIRELTEKLNDFETDMSAFFNLMPVIIIIGDNKGNINKVNKEWTKILGWTENETKDIFWIDLLHPDDKQSTIDAVASLQDTGDTLVDYTNRYKKKGGGYQKIKWFVTKGKNGKSYALGIKD